MTKEQIIKVMEHYLGYGDLTYNKRVMGMMAEFVEFMEIDEGMATDAINEAQ